MGEYAEGRCWLGAISLVASPTGIRAVEFGDTDEDLRTAAQHRYGALSPGAAASDWLAKLITCLDSQQEPPELPLDPQGTPFQQSIWAALRTIPSGETRTYQELADALGRPGSVRAVARACATNPIAWLIPCHRVIRQDGSLAGYRWGLVRKQKLLESEGGLPRELSLFDLPKM